MDILRYAFVFLLALTLISCGSDNSGPDTTLYDVSVSIAPEGAGTIAPAADSSYEAGTTINLQANPNEDYVFTVWTGAEEGIDSTANPLSLTVDHDYDLIANFGMKSEGPFYLHENGTTIMCPDAEPGQKGVVNGVEYVAVDRTLLEQAEDLSKVCTSPVSNMAELFNSNEYYYGIGTGIGKWDVSNVTNMSSMFRGIRVFQASLDSWDVSNVTDMNRMFAGSYDDGGEEVTISFNGDISSWNVSNVTDMRSMFNGAQDFNQDLRGWCVSNIDEEPENFSSESALSREHHPAWGTCPQ